MTSRYQLVPIDTMDAHEVSRGIREQLANPAVRWHLKERHALGVLRRHNHSRDSSVRSIDETQKLHSSGKMAAFAIRRVDEVDVVGMATVMPGLPLLEHPPLPFVPPVVARLLGLSRDIMDGRTTAANVNAWGVPGEEPVYDPDDVMNVWQTSELINDAYEGLIGHAVTSGMIDYREDAWTIEPRRSSSRIHQGLVGARMVSVGLGRFDVYESRFVPPPESTLYQAVPEPELKLDNI